MAVKFYNFTEERYEEPKYVGAVLDIREHYWLDGMTEETAVCWNDEKKEVESFQVGYYGSDGRNMSKTIAEVDATKETWKAVLRSFRPSACKAFAESVINYKKAIHVGTHAEVIKGKKVPKGTKVEVFWIGEKATWRSRQYSWMHETETIAGCYDEDGNKLWIKADYLKNTDPLKSPNAKERRKFIKAYMNKQAHSLGAPWKYQEG